MQGPVCLLAAPVISKGQLHAVSTQVAATPGLRHWGGGFAFIQKVPGWRVSHKMPWKAVWRVAANGAGVG